MVMAAWVEVLWVLKSAHCDLAVVNRLLVAVVIFLHDVGFAKIVFVRWTVFAALWLPKPGYL